MMKIQHNYIISLINSIIIAALLAVFPVAYSQPVHTDWNTWVAQTRQQAIEHGINPKVFDDALKGVYPDKKTIHLDRTQPERRLTFAEYRKSRGDAYRIKLGKKYCRKHQQLLDEIADQYGVAPRYIVTFWGMESSYGNFMGNFPVIKSLATLAYEGRRGDFFKKQLFAALQILQEGHISLKDFKGEWAGGSGQPQFLPTSWQQFAVDYNGDGHKDIWKTKSDVFASIANYLVQNGWQKDQPWGYEVILPYDFPTDLVGEQQKQSVANWQNMGVRTIDGSDLPHTELAGWIIQPDGGPAHLVFNNFNVFKTYNNSTFYAGTIGYMSDRICQ